MEKRNIKTKRRIYFESYKVYVIFKGMRSGRTNIMAYKIETYHFCHDEKKDAL
jgi:hypothetical protein